ncbi:hypothetical protein B0H34DRAFT_701681 [Crassisporium funariophilum]|nr:hypothetical protein B0H34DRAFT_701681 [Crassisporium funariophilum]
MAIAGGPYVVLGGRTSIPCNVTRNTAFVRNRWRETDTSAQSMHDGYRLRATEITGSPCVVSRCYSGAAFVRQRCREADTSFWAATTAIGWRAVDGDLTAHLSFDATGLQYIISGHASYLKTSYDTKPIPNNRYVVSKLGRCCDVGHATAIATSPRAVALRRTPSP